MEMLSLILSLYSKNLCIFFWKLFKKLTPKVNKQVSKWLNKWDSQKFLKPIFFQYILCFVLILEFWLNWMVQKDPYI